MKKRVYSLICLTMALLLTASCGGGTASIDTTTASADTTTEALEFDRIAELGEHDFGGETFTILDQGDVNTNCPVEELQGEVLNDTIRQRNEMIEEMYNVQFEYAIIPSQSERANALKNSVMADDNDYDLIFSILPESIAPLSTQGILADLCQIDTLSLDESWWSPLLYDSVRLGGKMYYTTGDISPISYRSPVCFYANQKLLAENQISSEEIYDHVENGSWTLDVLYTYAGHLDRDLNGDGQIVIDDDYLGIGITPATISSSNLVCASGVSLSTIDSNGKLGVDLNNESVINIIEKLKGFLNEVKVRDTSNAIHLAFKEDRVIFAMHYCSSGYTRYRDMASDYMMLPLAKYDEKQENYCSLMNSWMNCFVALPTNADLERAGVIMETMAYWSYNNMREISYDLALKEKGIRNERDAVMMDIIKDSAYIDFNSIIEFGGSLSVLSNAIFNDAPFVSNIVSRENSIAAAIEEFEQAWLNEQ